MLYAVYAIDDPDAGARRQTVHPDHVTHLKSAKNYGVTIVVGGPLVADDGKTSIGSLMVLDVPDRATAEKFNSADPFRKNGIWAKIDIRRFDRRT
jgi:uncharacterized protein YciI